MYDTLINFKKEKFIGVDDHGNQINDVEVNPVFAELMSVSGKEFYEAAAQGFKPEVKFKLADFLDYDDEQLLEYEGEAYTILRTYRKGRELEITCGKGVQDGSAAVSSKD